MLDTLLKIGKWQSETLSKWARFIDPPKVFWEDKKGNRFANYAIDIVFDLDKQKVYLNTDNLMEYDPEHSPEYLRAIKIQGGNNKSIYATAEPKKLTQIFKTFFGKLDNEEADRGELMEAIEKDYPQFVETELYRLLEQVFVLRPSFLSLAVKEDKGKMKFDAKHVLDSLELGRKDKVVLLYASIKSEEFGYSKPTAFAQLQGYNDFLSAKFLSPDHLNSSDQERLCYASGETQEQVTELSLSTRYSLNKMFVTETKNYAHSFDKKAFSRNYQLGIEAQGHLDLASNYLLQNHKLKIAGIDHVVVPEFMNRDSMDLDIALEKIGISSEFLFHSRPLTELDELVKNIELETDSIFWLNFIAFDSDGNFFKTTGQIKDVSRFYFQRVLETFVEVNWLMRKMKKAVDWEAVNRAYGQTISFNFRSAYQLIPVRKDKEKKNKALALFKSILENRGPDPRLLFEYFCELIQCHYYGRYTAYKNVHDYSNGGNRKREDYFIWACRDSVFKYLAFIQVLKRLNLINMETKNEPTSSNAPSSEQVEQFFEKMGYSDSQKSMFHLGRMLNAVTYIQRNKKKTALEKVNFSGMDRDDIVRLRINLVEKAKQYGEVGKVIFHDARFGEFFDFENWGMPPQEAVFFLLTGYSYGLVKSESKGS